MAFRKAERRKAKLRLGLVGPAGSGKTYSSLLIAFGLGGRIALIDTENSSGDLYAHLGDYDVCTLEAPYKVEKYLAAIAEAEREGYDVIIIDSLSHAWAGTGGLLDQKGRIEDKSGNGWAAWRSVTPMHNNLIDAMLTSKCHIIATMRAKTEYVQERDEKGKAVIRKVGMAPVQRDGMDYEFTVVCDLDVQHSATTSKDRTSIFDGQVFVPSQETGRKLLDWLEAGSETPAVSSLSDAERKGIWGEYLEVCDNQQDHAQNAILKITDGRGSREWTREDYDALRADLARRREARTPTSLREDEAFIAAEEAAFL